ncbi:MAG: hypothetical protein ACT4NL_06660 [Pseudomarimonas sp.]
MKNVFESANASEVEGKNSRRAYAAPKLTVYGVIADFTAGGSGAVPENAKCNGTGLMMQNKC